MDKSMLSVIAGITKAKLAWEAIDKLSSATSAANVMQLKRQLHQLQKTGKESIAVYFQRAKQLQFDLADAKVTVSDDDLVMHLLDGLTPDYANIRQVLLAGDKLPDYNNLLSKLLKIEVDINASDNTQVYYGSSSGDYKSRLRCHYCNKKGHLKKDCWKRRDDMAAKDKADEGGPRTTVF